MSTIDFSPLFRTTVGFDRMARLVNSLSKEPNESYPPYNIEVIEEDKYRITIAVAGFSNEDIEILLEESQLLITGKIKRKKINSDRSFLYRGIAERSFQRRFNLAEHVVVKSADLDNGLLHIDLYRKTPKEMNARRIPIGLSTQK